MLTEKREGRDGGRREGKRRVTDAESPNPNTAQAGPRTGWDAETGRGSRWSCSYPMLLSGCYPMLTFY
eukprot:7397042-Pyramimonas_sp.AAC.1